MQDKQFQKRETIESYISYIYQQSYKETPPTMDEFLSNPEFLGGLTRGGKDVYPIWKDTLRIVAREDTKYVHVLTGAIGIGKTYCAIYGMLYTMCRILCLEDPWRHFEKAAGGQMSIVFFNLTKSQSESTAYKLFQNHLINSPWFVKRGRLCGAQKDRLEFPLFKYTFASPFVPGFGCLVKDTKISLLDGRELTIPEIMQERAEGKCHWVYSYDTENRKMVPGKVSFAGKTKEDANLVKVLLDNGRSVTCTLDHPFMLRDGTYKEAQYLTPGESLMPLYRKVGEEKRSGRFVKMYELFHCGIEKWERTHNVVGEYIYGKRKKNEIFHHQNFNKRDNNPENLLNMDKQEHWEFHSYLAKSRTPELLEQMRKSYAEWLKTPEGIAARKRISERTKKMNKNPGHIKKVVAGMKKSKKYKEIHGKILADYNRDPKVIQERKDTGVYRKAGLASAEAILNDPEKQKHVLDGRIKAGQKRRRPREKRKCKNSECSIVFECLEDSSKEYCSVSCFAKTNFQGDNNPNSKKNNPNRILIPWNKDKTKETDSILAKTAKKISKVRKFQCREKKNHKVVSVEFLNTKEDVYDITVEGNHNFATTAGVFVHNSQGEHIVIALLDEVDSPIASEVQREKVVKAYENARRRLDSRFVKHGETMGRFFMLASKQQRLSFLNTFIAKYKTSKNVLIVDVPLWLARPRTDYAEEEFTVSCGDVYNPPKVVENKEDLEQVTRAGYKILRVPMDFYDIFLKDIVGALRDIAGVSVSHIRATKLFPSESLILQCFEHEAVNPVKQMTINIGLEDDVDLMNYLDLSKITIPRHIPRFIHQDFSYSGDGDATGLAMSCISGWPEKNVEDDAGNFHVERCPDVHTDFAMRIKAYPGDRIPLNKIRKLILDLKKIHGFNIFECTFDLRIGTEDTKQILERSGIACDHLSMDKDPQRYRDFSKLVMEKRWSSPWHPYLHFELKNLEEDPDRNMIDHPKEVAEMQFLEDGNTRETVCLGSKDLCLSGETKISLLDGRELSILEIKKELEQKKKLHTYSVDLKNQRIVPGEILDAFQSGYVKKMLRIVLDNDEKICCTKEHPFIDIDGKYIEAQDLREGMSLLPVYRNAWEGYRYIKNPFSGENNFEHRLFSGFLEEHLSCNKFLVHHKDFNFSNNNPENLEIMTRTEHSKLHALLISPEKLKFMQEKAQEVMATADWKDKQAEIGKRSIKKAIENGNWKSWAVKLKEEGLDLLKDPRMQNLIRKGADARRGVPSWNAGLSAETDERVLNYTKKTKETIKRKNQRLKEQLIEKFICEFCEKEFKNTNACFVKNHSKSCKVNQTILKSAICPICEERFENIKHGRYVSHIGNCAIREKKKKNHKIKSVSVISKPQPVYDLTVKEYHNFALSAGVFVHNSDAVAGSTTRAIEKCVTPPDIEVMNKLMEKCKPVPVVTDLNMLRLAGVDTKEAPVEEEEKKNLKEKQTAYNDLLKRLRNKQTGLGGFMGFKGMI